MNATGTVGGARTEMTPTVASYGIDSMVLVYHFEANPTFGMAASRILGAAESNRCRLVASILAEIEVLVVPKREGVTELVSQYRDFFRFFPNLEVVDLTTEIADLASDLRARYSSLRTPDAIHIATAVASGVDKFISADERLPHLEEIAVVGPQELRF